MTQSAAPFFLLGGNGQSQRTKRTGLVTADGHAVADKGGRFNALGLTFFWSPWGYKFDRERLEMNIGDVANDADGDYLRGLGSVGPEGWRDRTIDPAWPDYDNVIADLTDMAYDRYGQRFQWTLFGGGSVTPKNRRDLIDRHIAINKGREHKIFAYELSNEGQGYDGDLKALRADAEYLQARVPNLVAITTHNGANACELYAGAKVSAITVHYDRKDGADTMVWNGRTLRFRPDRQPWGSNGEYDAACAGQLNRYVIFNNEPIGPKSSGNMDDDPMNLAVAYQTTFIAQNGAYVLHCGPGIRGGGYEDVNQEPGKVKPYVPREANFRDQPQWTNICRALRIARDVLPPGLSNWTRANSQWASCPFRGFDKADEAGLVTQVYHTFNGPDTWSIAHGVKAAFEAWPVAAMHLEWLHPETCQVLHEQDLAAGEPFTMTPDLPAWLLRGRLL